MKDELTTGLEKAVFEMVKEIATQLTIKDELTTVLEKATFEELKEIATQLTIDVKTKNTKTELISEINYWTRYYSESFIDKFYYVGSGIPYIEILKKVSNVIKLKISSNPTVDEIETKLLDYVYENLPADVKEKLEKSIEIGNMEEIKNFAKNMRSGSASGVGATAGLNMAAVQAAKYAAFQTAKAAGLGSGKALFSAVFTKGLSGIATQKALQQTAIATATRFGLMRGFLSAIAGPVGWGLLGYSIVSFAFSESYKTIIPVTIMIAQLRLIQKTESEIVIGV